MEVPQEEPVAKETTPAVVKAAEYDVEQAQDIIFQPNEGPQTEFLSASEQELLFGGSAGGGKSWAMLADPLRDMNNPQFNGLLLRRTTEELRELVAVSHQLYPKAIPGIKWSERKMQWTTPQGGTFWLSYLDKERDVTRYQGQAFNWIGFDELTQWPTPYPWNYMRSRLRTAKGSGLSLYQRSTSNPGGSGHCVPFGEVLTKSGWVSIDKVEKGDSVLTMDKEGSIFYQVVSDTVSEDYEGTMVKRNSGPAYMEFTENHRLPNRDSSGFTTRPFYNLPGQSNILRAGNTFEGWSPKTFTVPYVSVKRRPKLNQPKTVSFSDFSKFMGWFISEGHTLSRDKEFGISQTKEPQRTEIKELLSRMGFSFRESSTGFQVSCTQWYTYLEQFGKCRKKFIPDSLLDSAHLKELFTSLMDGDGHWGKRHKSGDYYTTSKVLFNQVQEVCLKLGYSVRGSSKQRKERVGLSYTVHFSSRKTTELNTGNHVYNVNTKCSKTNIEKYQYKGKVYCITVPETEVFFIRQNGYVWLSGNTWVKKMFIDPAKENTSFWATDIDTGETIVWPKGHKSGKEGQPLFKRRFIPAKLFDNPYLAEDGLYEANLLSLPEHQRRQLLEGDWDVNEGAAFSEFNRLIHVVEPFDIPRSWVKFRACDYGYGSHSGVIWFTIDPSTEQLIVYREMYTSKVTAVGLADMILEAESGESIRYGVLDSSLWHNRGDTGPSLAEQMIMRGCRWRPSDRSRGSRVAGKNELHRRLQVDEYTKRPKIVFFSNCLNTISQIPALPLDKNNPEDVDTHAEDHLYDALRYGIMSRPRSSLWDHNSTTQVSGMAISDSIFGY